jgi:hypothetical protein
MRPLLLGDRQQDLAVSDVRLDADTGGACTYSTLEPSNV